MKIMKIKKMKKLLTPFLLFAMLVNTTYNINAWAELVPILLPQFSTFPMITLGTYNYSGTGCPTGSVTAQLTNTRNQLQIIFKDYNIITTNDYERNNCNFVIPINVPRGYAITIQKMEYRGLMKLPRGAESTISSEYFFAGIRGPVFNYKFNGPHDKNYLLENALSIPNQAYSSCGETVNLRVNSYLSIKNPTFDTSHASIGEMPVVPGIIYSLNWKKCQIIEPFSTF